MIKQEVEKILMQSRIARNSDRYLLLQFMQNRGMELSPRQKELFLDMPSMETIRRVRQKLQSEGRYPADQKIANERKFKGLQMQQLEPKLKSDQIEKVIEPQQQAISWLNDE